MFKIRRLGVLSPLDIKFTPCTVALYFCTQLFLSAGDPIIMSNEKGKTDSKSDGKRMEPPRLNGTGSGFLKEFERGPAGDLLHMVPPSTTDRSAPYDRKQQKKMQNIQDERANWLLLRPGELQEKDEAEEGSFGVRDENLDGLDNENRSRNYLFYGLAEPKNSGQERSSGQSRNASQSRVPGQSRNQSQKARPESLDEDPEGKGKESRGASGQSENRDSQTGAHTSSELNLKGLLDFGKSGSALSGGPEKTEPGLASLLNSGGSFNLSREQQARREERMKGFDQILNAPSSVGPLSGPSGLTQPPSDFGRQPADSGFGRSLDVLGRSSGGSAGGAPVGNSRLDFGSFPSRYAPSSLPSQSLPSMTSPRAAGFSSLPSANFGPSGFGSAGGSRSLSPASGLEAPRRKF